MRFSTVIVLIVLLTAMSCGEPSNQTSNSETSSTEEFKDSTVVDSSSPKEIELLSIISDLNVRNTPGKEGVVIDKLQFGQRAIWYGEETDFKEKIIMRNIPRFSTWKKIKFSGSGGKGALDGWVYGGGMLEKDQAYKNMNDSTFQREFKAITKDEIIEVVGVDDELSGGSYFSGYMSYKQDSRKRKFLKNGAFEFKDWEVKELSDEKNLGVKLTGNFTNGKLEGELRKTRNVGPYSYTCELTYQNGACIKASIDGICYGQEISYETERASECSFKFLESTLKEEE